MHRSLRPASTAASIVLCALLAAPPAPAQERISFTAKDGHTLAGTLMAPASGAPRGGVVALPMAKSQRIAFDPLLPRLAHAGLIALAIEPRYDANVERAESRPDDFPSGRMDLDAALEQLVAHGAPIGKLAVVGAASGANLAIAFAMRTGVRVKALVLLSPGRDDPLPSAEEIQELGELPILIIATSDEADRGAKALKELLPSAEIQIAEDRLASGTGMFGRVKGIESTIADWLDRMLAQPSTIEIRQSKLVLIDGEIAPNEAAGAATILVPLGNGSDAKVRLTHSGKRLDIGFDIPEPYVRLNEVVVYIDSSDSGGHFIDKSCYRVSFNPKNPAHKPLIVQRGGLKGFEDSDEKGVIAFARTPVRERQWSAEVSLDLSRFLPGDLPKTARIAFQINGQRLSDVRYYPDDAKVPTASGAWAIARLK